MKVAIFFLSSLFLTNIAIIASASYGESGDSNFASSDLAAHDDAGQGKSSSGYTRDSTRYKADHDSGSNWKDYDYAHKNQDVAKHRRHQDYSKNRHAYPGYYPGYYNPYYSYYRHPYYNGYYPSYYNRYYPGFGRYGSYFG